MIMLSIIVAISQNTVRNLNGKVWRLLVQNPFHLYAHHRRLPSHLIWWHHGVTNCSTMTAQIYAPFNIKQQLFLNNNQNNS